MTFRHVALLLLLARTAAAAPTVTINFPDPEIATIDGPIPFTATAETTSGRVSSVRFYLDGALLVEQPGPGTRPQQTVWRFFAQRWDSRTVANGTHTLVVQAVDSTGASSAQMRSFVVDNTPWQCVPAGTPAGDSAAINNALSATHRAVLCPNTTYYLLSTIALPRAGSIYTLGYPIDGARARLVYNSSANSRAIDAGGQSLVSIRSVQITGPDGSSSAPDHDENGVPYDALVSIGGWATDMFVDSTRIADPNGWSLFHIFEGPGSCAHAVITRNDIGPSRYSTDAADGISLSCRDSIVTDNTVIDPTDGGIVAFGSPGSLVARNAVTSFTRILHGAINMVDTGGWGGDFTGTRVESNTIDAKWGIRSAVAVGLNTWGCANIPVADTAHTVHGGAVVNNTMTGPNMGYGIPVNGARDWVVSGNTSTASHGGTPVGCAPRMSAAPQAFQALSSYVSGVTLQPGYLDARVEFLPGLVLTRATSDRVLTDGVPVALSDASAGTDVYYDFYVPPGTTRFSISIAGTSGDADLYVRRDAPPTTDLWTCRPYTSSSNESCGDNFPVDGHYYVMVRAYSAYSRLTLTATRSTALWSGIPLPDVRGLKYQTRYTSIAIPSGTHTLTVNTSGGPGDVDLYVSRTNPTPDVSADCASYTSTATESCTLTVTGPSTAYIGMKAYGDYVRAQLTATVSP